MWCESWDSLTHAIKCAIVCLSANILSDVVFILLTIIWQSAAQIYSNSTFTRDSATNISTILLYLPQEAISRKTPQESHAKLMIPHLSHPNSTFSSPPVEVSKLPVPLSDSKSKNCSKEPETKWKKAITDLLLQHCRDYQQPWWLTTVHFKSTSTRIF